LSVVIEFSAIFVPIIILVPFNEAPFENLMSFEVIIFPTEEIVPFVVIEPHPAPL
jgi:hypothetical protein